MPSDIAAIEARIAELKEELRAVRQRVAPQPIPDLVLSDRTGAPRRLSEWFGGKRDLLVIHNMGRRCTYCTLWADGFIGLHPHLADRAGFVLVSEDEPSVLDAFARSRGWPFPVASMHGTDFARILGVETSPGHTYPGVSALTRDPSGSILRTGHANFGPGDDFCAAWPLFELLRDGAGGWEPKLAYGGCGAGCGCHGGAKS